jgi:hypothetical protein
VSAGAVVLPGLQQQQKLQQQQPVELKHLLLTCVLMMAMHFRV